MGRIASNVGLKPVALTGWTLRDALPAVDRFGTFTLGAGKTVVVRTRKRANSATARYWGMGRDVWNNPGDEPLLRSAAGVTEDTCAWTKIGIGDLTCP